MPIVLLVGVFPVGAQTCPPGFYRVGGICVPSSGAPLPSGGPAIYPGSPNIPDDPALGRAPENPYPGVPYPKSSSPTHSPSGVGTVPLPSPAAPARAPAPAVPVRAPASPVPVRAPAPAVQSPKSGSVSVELWRDISALPSAPWKGPKPRVFTYVLSGDSGGNSYIGTDQKILHARANLDALVAETRTLESSSDPRAPPLQAANLFCIPAKAPARVGGAPYDYQLARLYRQNIQGLLANQPQLRSRLDGVGPFLVAARLPLNEIIRKDSQGLPRVDQEGHVVIIDLSSAEPASIVIFVKEFKTAIRRDDVLADRELAPLRPAIVSALLRVNAAIPFIAGAYASINPTSSSKSPHPTGQ